MATVESPVIQTVVPVTHDLGDFKVNRTLPGRERTMVGPFIFVDEFGPAQLPPGQGMDVRPHPHINLATVTYLFEGAIEHRDSIGSRQVIEPGAINLMLGIANAQLDSHPLVAIAAQAGLDRIYKESHQFVDLVSLYRPITKWGDMITVRAAAPEMVIAVPTVKPPCRPYSVDRR